MQRNIYFVLSEVFYFCRRFVYCVGKHGYKMVLMYALMSDWEDLLQIVVRVRVLCCGN